MSRTTDPPWLRKALADGSAAARGVNAAALAAGFRVEIDPASESAFTREVIDLARSFGWLVAHFRSVRVARADGTTYWQTPVQGDGEGFPDLVLCRLDRCVVAELKRGKNATTDAQDEWLDRFRRAGVPAYVWREEDMPVILTALA